MLTHSSFVRNTGVVLVSLFSWVGVAHAAHTPRITPNFIPPITVGQSMSATVFPVNGTTTLHLSPGNPDSTNPQSGITVTDNLPAGLAVATPNGLTGGCAGATISAVPGSNLISLSGFNLAPDAQCDVFIDLIGTAPGVLNNSAAAFSNEGGAGNPTVVAVTVVGSPALTASFGTASIPQAATTSLTYTLQSPNSTVALSGIAFTDTLPAGLAIATPNGLSGSCSGTITATAGTNSVALSGATLPANGTCTFAVNVIGSTAGLKVNTTSTVSSVEGGVAAAATGTLDVVAPPSLAQVFGPAVIGVNGVTSVGFTLTGPAANSATLSGVGFSDSLPAGLVVATPNGLANGCSGAVITANAGSGTITMSGGTLLPNAQCLVVVNVTGTSPGSFTNTTGAVVSANGGNGNAATASLTVVTAPTIAIAFGAASMPLSATTTLTFTLNNANASPVTGLAFTDTLPAGLVVATPNALSGGCGGGAITALSGSNSISLSAGTLPPSASCSFTVDVKATAPGASSTTTGPLSSNENGVGPASNVSTVVVVAPPALALNFTPSTVVPGAASTLSFTITNPNPGAALTGVGVSDTLPAGLTVATPNGLVGTCGAGTLTATAGGTTIALSGATLASGTSCTFSLNIATSAGSFTNTTGAVVSANGGNGNAASASIVAASADLTIAKTHVGSFQRGQSGASYTITVSNVGTSPGSGTVTVTDVLPAGLTATAMSGTGWACSLAPLACTRNDALAPAASYPQIMLTVDVAANAPASVTNQAVVSGGADANAANDTASDGTVITAAAVPLLSPAMLLLLAGVIVFLALRRI